jgi:hypothetical protein
VSPKQTAVAWIVGGVVGALIWILLLDGFAAGTLVVLTLVVAALAAYFSWEDV